jgi:hypothetical protein
MIFGFSQDKTKLSRTKNNSGIAKEENKMWLRKKKGNEGEEEEENKTPGKKKKMNHKRLHTPFDSLNPRCICITVHQKHQKNAINIRNRR